MLPSPLTDIKAFVPPKIWRFPRPSTPTLDSPSTGAMTRLLNCRSAAAASAAEVFRHPACGNFMMGLSVDDADAWWEYIEKKESPKKYPGIMCKPPAMQPRGLRILYPSDPSGLLWHIAENRKSERAGSRCLIRKPRRSGASNPA